MTLATACPTLTQGGDDTIARWLDRNPDARMVVIDVFAKFRGATSTALSAYDADYTSVSRIKRLADAYGVATVLVHHVRKAGADDFLTEVSGTNAVASAADATLVLERPRGKKRLGKLTGSDVRLSIGRIRKACRCCRNGWDASRGKPRCCATLPPNCCGTQLSARMVQSRSGQRRCPISVSKRYGSTASVSVSSTPRSEETGPITGSSFPPRPVRLWSRTTCGVAGAASVRRLGWMGCAFTTCGTRA